MVNPLPEEFGPLVPQGKIGENTWNARLAEKLRTKGFPSSDFELHFPVLKGRPRKPDVAFTNGGTHLISGKIGEGKEFDAFSSAQEYQQLIGATTNLGEVFAVVYPQSRRESFILHLLANSQHERRAWRVTNLEEVVEIIHQAVQHRIDELKRPLEPPDASVVRLLRQGVDILYTSAKKADEQKLKEVFGGAAFFDSVLSEAIPPEERKFVLSKSASFLFVNQVLFYSVLGREIQEYPPIDLSDMSSPTEIRRKYFAKVLEKDFRPIFELDLSPLFDLEHSKDGCLRVTRLIQELSRSISAHDLIGKVFHEIIPLEFRKMVAAFYTNSAAGDLLAKLSIHDAKATILDPACGSGTLLVSAYHRKRELSQVDASNSIDLHKKFVQEQITGLDVMAFSAHLAAVQLLLQEPLQYTEKLRIATTDSTKVHPGMKIQAFGETIRDALSQRRLDDYQEGYLKVMPGELVKTGTVALGSIGSESFELAKVDVVIMNPPFTSSRRMSKLYKTELKERFRAYPRYANLVKGNIGYHLYFVCIADRFLNSGGRMAAVVPFTTLVGGDFSELVRFLVKEYSIEFVVCGRGRSAYSENTMFSEVMFVAKKQPPSESHKAVLLLTKTSPLTWTKDDIENLSFISQHCASTGRQFDTELGIATPFDQHELLPEGKTLTGMVAELDEKYRKAGEKISAEIIQDNPLITTFGELISQKVIELKVAEVVHGKSNTGEGHSLTRFGGDALIACRTAERALMKHDRLIYKSKTASIIDFKDKATNEIHKIPRDCVAPALRRFAYISKFDLSDDEDFVVTESFPGIKKLFDSILGKERSLSSMDAFKKEWADVVVSGSAKLVMPGRIDLAAPGSKILAVRGNKPLFMCSFMWGISGVSKHEEKILVLWLNSALFFYLLLARQTVTRGSWVKFHGKPLKRVNIINFPKLSDAAKERLVKAYDNLSEFEWPPILDQYTSPSKERVRLDLEILRALGIKEEEDAKKLTTLLYDAIAAALKTMQTTMDAD